MTSPRRSSHQSPQSEWSDMRPTDVVSAVRHILGLRNLENMPLQYVMLVEGTTDIDYLKAAIGRVREATDCDLSQLGDGVIMSIHTPTKHGGRRGGTPELVRLARDLMPFAIRLEAIGPLCFVLDHDDEGKRAAGEIRDMGYRGPRATVMTLDPSEHPDACRPLKGEPSLSVEDLLSAEIQGRFFNSAPASCEVSFCNGAPVKYVWHADSKYELPGFVEANGTVSDVRELVRLIARVRRLWNIDVPSAVESLLSPER